MTDTPFRPLVTIVRPRPDGSAVEVALDDDGRLSAGEAAVVDQDLLTAAGQATCRAIEGLLVPDIDVWLAWVEQHPPTDHRQALVNAGVTVHSDRGREELLGSAFVRTDPQVAAVRAVLHALPRRITAQMRR